MGRKQWWLIVIGVILVVALFVLRNQPHQTTAIDAFLQQAKDSLSTDAWQQATRLESLPEEVQTDSLISFWKQQGNAAATAIYSLQLARRNDSKPQWLAAGNDLMSGIGYGRQQGLSDNLLFYFSEAAFECFDRVLQQDSTDADASIGMAMVYIEGRGQVMPGVRLLLDVLQRDSLHVGANLRLGRLSMVNGEYGNVIKRMKKVLMVEPDNGEAYITIASAWQAQGIPDSARVYLAKSLPFLPEGEVKAEALKRLNEL